MKRFYCFLIIGMFLILLAGLLSAEDYYNIGAPALKDIWVDPVMGSDSNSGLTRTEAIATLKEAWARVPSGSTLDATGYRINLTAGNYSDDTLPDNGWMESRYGTYIYPIIIQSADGPLTAKIHGYLNISDCRYLYLVDLEFITDRGYGGGGNVLHIEQGNHILVRGCKLNGFDGDENQPQETLKVNQSQYIYVENSDISGASWFSLDFVAVQYGHIKGNLIHNSGDDCVVLKGGTAYLYIENNEVYDCGNIAFAAGQGTGYEFMVTPWLHYEAYDLKFFNNIVHDAQNAGMAVRGGYNILFAYNTFYKIGLSEAGAPLLLISPGMRSCDGDTAKCTEYYNLGGWGPRNGDAGECIPNRNVYVYNNIFYNPSTFHTLSSHFTIFGPVIPPAETNIPSPVLSDDNLSIRGNIIWNGPSDHPLGIEEPDQGAQPGNPTCNAIQLRTENLINVFEPQFIGPDGGDFNPISNSNIFTASTYTLPNFTGGDRPETPLSPEGDLYNTVLYDYENNSRTSVNPPGAYAYNDGGNLNTIWYLAEGCTQGFDEYVLIMNPNSQSAYLRVTFMKSDGSTFVKDMIVGPASRCTLYVNEYIPNDSVSTMVESLNNVPVMTERAMYWGSAANLPSSAEGQAVPSSVEGFAGDLTWSGGHDSVGITELSTLWYLAEGCTNGFSEWILVMNPSQQQANLEVTFMKPDGSTIVKNIAVSRTSRYSINVNQYVQNDSVSVKIISDIPVAVERAMYWNSGNYVWVEGHSANGVTEASCDWYLAEGSTAGFDEWLLIVNPNLDTVTVLITFMKSNGTILEKSVTVLPTSRYTVKVNDYVTEDAVSVHLHADLPVIAERAMYWNSGDIIWAGGHDSEGSKSTGTVWYLPEGYTGSSFSTWILIMNPNNTNSNVKVTFMKPDGNTIEEYIFVPATTRYTINVNEYIANDSFSTKVESINNVPIIAERAEYWDSGNYHWKGGHNSLGVKQ